MVLFARSHSFRTLFLWMVAVFSVAGFVEGFGFGAELLFLINTLVLLSAVRAVQEKHVRRMLLMAAAVTIASNLAAYATIAEFIDVISLCCNLGMFSYLTWLVFLKVFSGRSVDADTIFGAVCIYVLLGLSWAVAYQLIELVDPGSFQATFDAAPPIAAAIEDYLRTYVYFSFTTLTSTGYGDIVPISSPARYAAILESMCGQIYLTVLVARVVGLHLSSFR
ncbi:MAG: hypothetical protein KDE14_13775 [Rhodobacteraceae bacterium]|nr:hypothetical protein [Paracoccaceae bacterium]